MKRRPLNRWNAAAAIVFSIALITAIVRATDYKRCIYWMERRTQTTSQPVRDSLTLRTERILGRPNYDPYRLPFRPKYKRFWADYNEKASLDAID